MLKYIVQRLLALFPVVILVTIIVFTVANLIPGDPAVVALGHSATPENVKIFRHKWGLDKPFIARYFIWLANVAHGDLGSSYISRKSVASIIAEALPVTLQLIFYALIIALIVAVPTAILAAVRQNSWIDLIATSGSLVGLAIPNFWLGIMLMILLAVQFRLFPASGYVSPFVDFPDHLRHMILPSITLAAWMIVPLIRFLRSELIRVLKKGYIYTARMKGLSEAVVIGKHAMRNGLIPFVTQLGMTVGEQIGGTIVLEQVFAIPGMGRTAIAAIFAREYQVVMGVVLVLTIGFLVINLLVDFLYMVLDPRIRLTGE